MPPLTSNVPSVELCTYVWSMSSEVWCTASRRSWQRLTILTVQDPFLAQCVSLCPTRVFIAEPFHSPLTRMIFHWSGGHKPIAGDGLRSTYRGSAFNDPIEVQARRLYMAQYHSWWARINTTALGATTEGER